LPFFGHFGACHGFGTHFANTRPVDPIWSAAVVACLLGVSFTLALALEWGLLQVILWALARPSGPIKKSPI
jgi:hypothetical protein